MKKIFLKRVLGESSIQRNTSSRPFDTHILPQQMNWFITSEKLVTNTLDQYSIQQIINIPQGISKLSNVKLKLTFDSISNLQPQ